MKVLLVVADSVRPDFLGCYGAARRTPSLDALAAAGALFETAITAAPWTIPSIGAMLSGVWSHRLGLVKWEQPWNRRIPTLFDYFRARGWTVGSFVCEPGQLFANYPEASVVCSSQDTDTMLAWLRDHRGTDCFAFVHWWWTHVPYLETRLKLPSWKSVCHEMLAQLATGERSGDAAGREYLRRLYALAIEAFSETWLPRIMDALRPDVTIVTADHGESWGERLAGAGPRTIFDLHGNHLFDEVLKVPLIFHAPRLLPRSRVRGLVRTVDILPTVLEILEIRRDMAPIAGLSLLPAIAEGSPFEPRAAFVSRNRDFLDRPDLPSRAEELYLEFAVRTDEFKVIRRIDGDDLRAYDLGRDPEEAMPIPLTPAGDPSSGSLDRRAWDALPRLARSLAEEIENAVVGSFDAGDFARMRAHLESLGYV